MNTPANTAPASLGAQTIPSAAFSMTRPFYWSVRRELWENRSIYIAPLAAAAIFLIGFLISTIHLPRQMRTLSPPAQHQAIMTPYDFIAGLLMLTAMVVGLFYCLDALNGERRDRSILFWKSLPVSDTTAVLAKASIPFVVLPLITFAVTVAAQWIMLLLSSAVLLGNGLSAGDALDAGAPLPHVTDAALSPDHRACALARTLLRLAFAHLGMGPARGLPVGRAADNRHRLRREDRLQHLTLRHLPGRPIRRRCGSHDNARKHAHRSRSAHHARTIPEQPGSVDRAGIHRAMSRRSGAAPPATWPALIG